MHQRLLVHFRIEGENDMAVPQPLPFVSEDDYLTGEPVSSVRHEYVNGQVYAMAGSSDKHNLISENVRCFVDRTDGSRKRIAKVRYILRR